ncbi:MAG: hypothetical protein RR497_02900 [Oscillospiraceae bacterium]
MADTKFASQQNNSSNGFKDAVCINAGRIYDSCTDKDCLEDLQVNFTPANQAIIDRALSVKCKCVQVQTVLMDVESVPFNNGFYSVDMTFYFLVTLDAVIAPMTPATKVEGISTFCKKVILYGSEGSVRTFDSQSNIIAPIDSCCCFDENIPKATINVAPPVVLSCKFCDKPEHVTQINFTCPPSIEQRFDDQFDCIIPKKIVCISVGLFSIAQLEREVQMMIPIYDYCIPDKECISTNDDPCEVFKKIKFPVNQFFPPKLDDCNCDENSCK